MTGEYNSRLKLLCYNVFYKEIEERKDNIFEVFLTRDADVMLLQEVSIPWISRLKEFMDEHGYSYYGYGRRGGEMMDKEMHEKEQFTPILWKTEKYDLVDKGHFFLSSTPEVFSAQWEDGTKMRKLGYFKRQSNRWRDYGTLYTYRPRKPRCKNQVKSIDCENVGKDSPRTPIDNGRRLEHATGRCGIHCNH